MIEMDRKEMMVEGKRERGKACEVVMARRRQRGGLAREKAEELKSWRDGVSGGEREEFSAEKEGRVVRGQEGAEGVPSVAVPSLGLATGGTPTLDSLVP